MMNVKNHFAPDPNVISKLVQLGMGGPQGKQLLQQYYNNPPSWMTPSEAKLYVPLAAERLDRIAKETQKIAAPQTTVAEDKIAGLAGIQPQQAPVQQQAQPEQQAQPQAQPQGGVADLPVSDDMFQEKNMAGGGIVAFDGGGEVPRFANRGLVALNTPQLNDNLQYLYKMYNEVPAGSPEQAKIISAIEQINGQMNGQVQAPTTPSAPAGPYANYPVLQQADTEVQAAKKGIAGLMGDMEYKPEELKKIGDDYLTQREGAGSQFRTKAEELMTKKEARVADMGKDLGLKTALNFFTNLAGTKERYFGTAFGQAGSKAQEYYDAAQEKQQRAQDSVDAMNMNYQLARAAEAKGDFDARDKFMDKAQDNKRQATTAQITGYKAMGELAASQAQSFLNLKKAETDKVRADADLIRAKAPPDLVQTIQYMEGKVRKLNDSGAYNSLNGGKKLSEAQIQAVANGYIVDLTRRGAGDTYKGATLDTAVANQVQTELTNNKEYIAARDIATDPKATQADRDTAEKTMRKIESETDTRLRSRIKSDFNTANSRERSLIPGLSGVGVDAANPLGLNLPKL